MCRIHVFPREPDTVKFSIHIWQRAEGMGTAILPVMFALPFLVVYSEMLIVFRD